MQRSRITYLGKNKEIIIEDENSKSSIKRVKGQKDFNMLTIENLSHRDDDSNQE
jgi:hypothetical protein